MPRSAACVRTSLRSEVVRETHETAALPKTQSKARPVGHTVKLTHPDRIYWPEQGVTKQGLADYYTDVWPYIAPFIVGRPLALLRSPEGIAGQSFFQKHAWKGLNPNIVLVNDPKDKDDEPLISINDLDGLIGLVQSAVLEIHPWGSTVKDWERPDIIIMDLDPGEEFRGRRSSPPHRKPASGSSRPALRLSSRRPAARACMWWRR